MATTLNDVIRFIYDSPECTPAAMSAIALAFKQRSKFRVQALKNSFSVGEQVSFTDPRSGQLFAGTIVKRGRSLLHVRTASGGIWRVAPSLLKRA